MSLSWRKIGVGLSMLLLALALGLMAQCIVANLNRLHAYVTEARMVRIRTFLFEDQPRAVDSRSFLTLLKNHDAEDYFRDGWGRPFVIEMRSSADGRKNEYRIISLGRSGRRSACCIPMIDHNWDLNCVMDSKGWVQLWNF